MMYELREIGFSTAIGIGGDPIIGTTHIDALAAFEADPETKAIVMIGEIGGDAEERAADFIKANVTKPVVGYVAGFTAPEGKTMGHAGAIVSGSAGTAQAKKEALEAAGVKVGKTPSETADLMREIIAGLCSRAPAAEGGCRGSARHPLSSLSRRLRRRRSATPAGAAGVLAREHAAVRDEVGGDLLEHDAHVLLPGAEHLDGGARHLLGEAPALLDRAARQEFDPDVRHGSSSDAMTSRRDVRSVQRTGSVVGPR